MCSSDLFWSAAPDPCNGLPSAASAARLMPAALLVAAIMGLTIFAGPVDRYARRAAQDVGTPGDYVERVLETTALRWTIRVEPDTAEGASQ